MESANPVLINIAIIGFVGIIMIIISHHLKIPAIVLLLAGGIIMGPEVLNIIDPEVFGDNFKTIVSLCVAIILFEGGLSLNPDGYRSAPRIIRRLLTIGVLITWLGTSILVFFIFQYSFTFSLVAGSLIIVTGPTVISPILKRLNIKSKLHQILHWEAILIDPIGVFIAVLAFEWLYTEQSISIHIYRFGIRFLLGVGLGVIGGLVSSWLLKRKWIHDEHANIFVLVVVIMLYSISDMVIHESGILTVIVAGFVISLKKPAKLEGIKGFKSELTELSVAILFLLLAANLNINYFLDQDWRMVLLIVLVIFVIRPLNIFISAIKSSTTIKERFFLSWLSPRGIVAAAMASLFAIELASQGNKDAVFLEIFTFSIIIVSVFIQGLSAKKVSELLKVNKKKPSGWLIIGVHKISKEIADFIFTTTGQECIFIDQNADLIEISKNEGYKAIQGDAIEPDTFEGHNFTDINTILVLTDNKILNQKICEKWSVTFNFDHLFYWADSIIDKNEDLVGIPIWQNLSRPSEISFNIEQNNLRINRSELKNISTENSQIVLLNSVNNKCLPYFKDQDNIDKGEVLVINDNP